MTLSLPQEVFDVIASFISDPKSLCACARTCRAFHKAAALDVVWKTLGGAAWKISPLKTCSVSGFSTYRRAYKRRFLMDSLQKGWVTSVANQQGLLLTDRLQDVFGYRPPRPRTAAAATLETADALKDLARSKTSDDGQKCLAAITLEWVHAFTVHQRINAIVNDDTPASLEEGAVLLSRSLASHDELLVETNDVFFLETTVNAQLDGYAALLRKALSSAGTASNISDQVSVQTLSDLLSDSGFSGNTQDYYNVDNSSISSVLSRRTGIPMTLAVIYKLILHRVGVTVNIIGLPGHVMLGLQSGTTYFDVFHGGRLQTLDDCVDIVRLRGLPWRNSYASPLTVADVVTRMKNNIRHCLARSFDQQKVHSKKIRTIVQLERYQPGQRHAFPDPVLDPTVFLHYRMIDEKTERACHESNISLFLGRQPNLIT